MINRVEKIFGDIKVVQRSDYKWGIVDSNDQEIVPFGKYDWIDSFDQGLCRVKIGMRINASNDIENKWGIINTNGEEVLPVTNDSIWNFAGKNRFSTKVINNGIQTEVYFHNLNPSLPVRGILHNSSYDDSYNNDYEEQHYEEYANTYAQNVAGYSDEEINDAFDGEPDAYWNID